jgi:excisionase family DNA binding protein
MRNVRRLTVVNAADSTGRHPATIRRWIRSGRLPATKVAGRYVIRAGDLEPLLEADLLPVPSGWARTSTGEPMPNVVAAIRRSRAERSRELQLALRSIRKPSRHG